MSNQINQKKILALNDLSCLGRASLAVIAPAISAMGHQVISMPTVLLSTHTGGFGTPAKLQTNAFAHEALLHYKNLGITFDIIYTGYLGGAAGAQLAQTAFELFPSAKKLVDPVMADNGKLYSGVNPEWRAGLETLCTCAQVITPNYTEAHLLLHREIPAQAPTKAYVEALAQELTTIAPTVIITGIDMGDYLGIASAGAESFYLQTPRKKGNFHGTGDLFAAVLTGALASEKTLKNAAEIAADFVSSAIENTTTDDTRFGLCFEPLLYKLANNT